MALDERQTIVRLLTRLFETQSAHGAWLEALSHRVEAVQLLLERGLVSREDFEKALADARILLDQRVAKNVKEDSEEEDLLKALASLK
jgi:hypothetical protein